MPKFHTEVTAKESNRILIYVFGGHFSLNTNLLRRLLNIIKVRQYLYIRG